MNTFTSNQLEQEYAKFQRETSWYAHAHMYDAGEICYLTLGLAGEAGEFADNVKKVIRDTGFEDYSTFRAVIDHPAGANRLIDELGDTFWYLHKLGRYFGMGIDDLMILNTLKLYERMQERPHGQLSELKWPFSGVTYEEAVERFKDLRVAEKEHDGVR